MSIAARRDNSAIWTLCHRVNVRGVSQYARPRIPPALSAESSVLNAGSPVPSAECCVLSADLSLDMGHNHPVIIEPSCSMQREVFPRSGSFLVLALVVGCGSRGRGLS